MYNPLAASRKGVRCTEIAAGLLAGLGVVLVLLAFHWPVPGVSAAPENDVPTAARPTEVNTGDQSASASSGASAAPTRSRPVHLDIPRINVHTPLMSLGLNPDGTVMVPPGDPDAPAGWYRYLASPGDPGPAVLLGHVDSYRGPAAFYRLHSLRPGDGISVRLADGRTVSFTVESVHLYPKAAFPTEAVYGQTTEPVLRLVTCGGAFDRARRTYLSNVVVYASLAFPRFDPATTAPGPPLAVTAGR